jgi:outer membrane murein-binding lipoprotein Lpp
MTQLDMSQQVQEDFMNSISEKENMTIQQYVQAQSHINIITNLKFLRDWNNEYAAKIGELIKTVEKMESSQESISSDITILKENLTAQKEEAANLQSEIEKETTELNKLIEESKPKYQGVELQYSATYNVTSNKLTVSKGVVNYNGHKETYYSQKVLPGNGLNIPGRHVADDGTIRDGDGYICVAADSSFYSKGSKLMTSLGPAKVYDTGCAYGTIDIYVNW